MNLRCFFGFHADMRWEMPGLPGQTVTKDGITTIMLGRKPCIVHECPRCGRRWHEYDPDGAFFVPQRTKP